MKTLMAILVGLLLAQIGLFAVTADAGYTGGPMAQHLAAPALRERPTPEPEGELGAEQEGGVWIVAGDMSGSTAYSESHRGWFAVQLEALLVAFGHYMPFSALVLVAYGEDVRTVHPTAETAESRTPPGARVGAMPESVDR